MNLRRALILAAAAATLTCSTADVYRVRRLDFPTQSGRLGNGLRVAIAPDPTLPYVVALLRFDVGAAFDPPGKEGLAHYVEHLASRAGDELVPAEDAAPPVVPANAASSGEAGAVTTAGAAPTAEAAAAQTATEPAATAEVAPAAPPAALVAVSPVTRVVEYLAEEDAWTDMNETVFYRKVPPQHLAELLATFARDMGPFVERLPDDVVTSERAAVLDERRQRYDGAPLDRAILDVYRRLYPDGHPYRGDYGIGAAESIAGLSRDDAAAFVAAHYHPANATLVIVGPVDAKAATDVVVQAFGELPAAPPSALQLPTWQPSARREQIDVAADSEGLVTVAWPLGPWFSREVEAMRYVRDRDWFAERLVADLGLAHWVSTSLREQQGESLLLVQALLRDPADADAAADALLEAADRLTHALGEDDLEASRRRQVTADLYDADSARQRAERMARHFAVLGTPTAWRDPADPMSLDEVHEVAERLLAPSRALVLLHRPSSPAPAAGAAPGEPAETDAPKYTAEAAQRAVAGTTREERRLPPTIYRFRQSFADYSTWAQGAGHETFEDVTLPNGLRCRFVRAGSLPVTYVDVRFAGGSLAEPAGKHGVASLLTEAIRQAGPADRAAAQRMGLQFDGDADDERLRFGMKFVSFYLDDALAKLAEKLASPKVRQRHVADSRDARLQAVRHEQNLGALTARAFWKVRGLDAVASLPSAQTLESIWLPDVWAYQDEVLYPENAVLTVVSDRPLAEVGAAVRTHFGAWGPADKPGLALGAAPAELGAAARGDIVVVPVPNAKRTRIELGFDAPGWGDWRGSALAHAAANLVDKRLEALRAATGTPWAAGAAVVDLRQRGAMSLSGEVEAADVETALAALMRQIDGARRQPVSDEQADWLRRELMLETAYDGGDSRALAQAQGTALQRALPGAFYRERLAWLAQVTTADVQRALDQLLGGDGLGAATLVLAGKIPQVPQAPARRRGTAFESFAGDLVTFDPAALAQ